MPGLDDEVLVVVVALVVEVSIGVGGSIGMETGAEGPCESQLSEDGKWTAFVRQLIWGLVYSSQGIPKIREYIPIGAIRKVWV